MYLIIEFPEHLKQYLLHKQRTKHNPKPQFLDLSEKCFDCHALAVLFRKPTKSERVQDAEQGLKVKIPDSMAQQMKIYLPESSRMVYISTINKQLKEKFRNDMMAWYTKGAKASPAIRMFLQENGIEEERKTFQLFEKDFYRELRKSHFESTMSETVRNRP